MFISNQNTRYDSKKMIRLVAVRGLFVDGKALEVGSSFEIQAERVAEFVRTGRAKFFDEADRPLVYKYQEAF